MNIIKNYILVDDDEFNNVISNIKIEETLGDVNIKTFTIPEEALAFIKDDYSKNVKRTILFLDINMPTLTGWEFIEEFEKFSEDIKNHLNIYVLSSSVNEHDKDRADTNPYVKGFISKPLEKEAILSAAGN